MRQIKPPFLPELDQPISEVDFPVHGGRGRVAVSIIGSTAAHRQSRGGMEGALASVGFRAKAGLGVTTTETPMPVPAVVLEISAPEITVICGAFTMTDPASPLAVAVAEAMIPVPDPVKFSGPPAVTRAEPPLPIPAAARSSATIQIELEARRTGK